MKLYEATEQAYKSGYEKGKEDATPKWISVKDRLPTKEDAKIMGEYLPAIQKGQKPNVWKWTEVAKHPQYFTHWYALPQPPKEGEHDG